MELEVLNEEEKRMNLILFVFMLAIPIVATTYVMLFNNGTWIDLIAVSMSFMSILVRLLKRVWGNMRSTYICPLCLFLGR